MMKVEEDDLRMLSEVERSENRVIASEKVLFKEDIIMFIDFK